jgi:hypothetical protein
MPRSYATEFPEFTAADIPAELLDATQWVDMSWHNETCPRFYSVATLTYKGEPARVCVWVEKANPAEREDATHPRFGVELVTVDDCEQFPTDTSADCDNIAQVMTVIAQFAAGGR